MAALDRPGLWIRVGMSGVISGLNMAEALASVSSDCDLEFCRRLFMIAEPIFVGTVLASLKTENETSPDG